MSNEFPTMLECFENYCEGLNSYSIGNFMVVNTGQNEGDYYRIYNGNKMLTEGDHIDIEARFKQIAKENGFSLQDLVM